MDFQTKNNLKVDGIVGPETFKALTPNDVSNTQDVKEYNNSDEDYNELDSLFTNNFDTEDDYDGEMFKGDDEGFSDKMRQNQIQKKLRLNSVGIGDDNYFRKKEVEVPRDKEGKEIKWSPIRDNEMPLDKYLEKKKMGNLDEDEDIAMLDNLFTKD